MEPFMILCSEGPRLANSALRFRVALGVSSMAFTMGPANVGVQGAHERQLRWKGPNTTFVSCDRYGSRYAVHYYLWTPCQILTIAASNALKYTKGHIAVEHSSTSPCSPKYMNGSYWRNQPSALIATTFAAFQRR